jgi:hypothetical protein
VPESTGLEVEHSAGMQIELSHEVFDEALAYGNKNA